MTVLEFLTFFVCAFMLALCLLAVTLNTHFVIQGLKIQAKMGRNGVSISDIDGDVNLDGDLAGRDIAKT